MGLPEQDDFKLLVSSVSTVSCESDHLLCLQENGFKVHASANLGQELLSKPPLVTCAAWTIICLWNSKRRISFKVLTVWQPLAEAPVILCSGNSLDSHRLVELAKQQGKQDEMVEELFLMSFVKAKYIGDR